jgi:HKD family nuclease
MKILTNSLAISSEIASLIQQCRSCQVAVAWASVKFDCFESLVANKSKIERMIVGLHFAQTHPDFIQAFLSDGEKVRFVHHDAGVFHPKVYLFKHSDGWDCVVGSPNFTRSAFTRNTETAVLLNHEDMGAETALAELTGLIDGYWQSAKALSERELDKYRTAWKKGRRSRVRAQKAAESKLRDILPNLPAELTAHAFTTQVRSGIERIPGVSRRWYFSKAGKTLKLKFRHSGQVSIQLHVSPKENKCYFEAVYIESPEIRVPTATSIREHMQNLQTPEGSVFSSEGAGIIRLAPPLHVKHLLEPRSVASQANQQEFKNEAARSIALFRFIDRAMQSWLNDSV